MEEMVTEDNDLEEELTAATNALISPPSSVQQLLPLLDKLEKCLVGLSQSSSDSMITALYPAIKFLRAKPLFDHVDEDVKVSVALCFSEIMRITAPYPPLAHERMKDIFQLIVSAFDNLSDTSSRSYEKRVSILETIAKTRSFLMFMDLECDSLILDMFKHFLGNLRVNHPDVVFSSMGVIMILILEEMEEIPLKFLSLLLNCVRNGNEGVLPITRKLGQRVIENCASKLAPYMHQAVKYTGVPLYSYDKIVVRICERELEDFERNFPASRRETAAKCLIGSEKCDPIRRRGRKSNVHKSKNGLLSSLPVPTESLSSKDVNSGEALQSKNTLLDNQCQGTSVPKRRRSSNKVDSKNDNEKNSVLIDALFNGGGVTNESGSKQLEEICVKAGAGANVKDCLQVKQWGSKKFRGCNARAIVVKI